MLRPSKFKAEGSIRVAFYERFSSDLQNDLSIVDQDHQMRAEASRLGWIVAEECIRADYAVSGQSLLGRNGLLDLIELARMRPRPFDAVMFPDTSRFGRRVSDVTRVREEFEAEGVFLYFASDHLDSRQPGFEFAFVFKAVQDQSAVKMLGEKVRQVQFSRFDAGHVPGAHTYGYRSRPVEDPDRKGPHGRPYVLYCVYEIVEEERVVIARIFREYAAGKSYAEIARILNAEGVKSPRNPRGRGKPSWAKSSIREIVQNTKYKGLFIWGKTSQERLPSGKIRVIHHPESTWEKRECPELRILDEDLWNRVQWQRQLKAAQAGKAFGGMSRTQTAREYLLSGKLRCGELGDGGQCRANMVLTVGNKDGKGKYGCADQRGRGTCKNALTVSVNRLEEALIQALSSQLATPELRDVIYTNFASQLKERLEADAREARAIASHRTELQQEKALLEKQIDDLIATIKDVGRSPRTSRELQRLEARLEVIEEHLEFPEATMCRQFDPKKLRQFVDTEAENFASALTADRVKAREWIRRHVGEITMTPKITEAGRFYELSGDVALFSVNEGSLQFEKGASIELQCTFPLRLTIAGSRTMGRSITPAESMRFAGVMPPVAADEGDTAYLGGEDPPPEEDGQSLAAFLRDSPTAPPSDLPGIWTPRYRGELTSVVGYEYRAGFGGLRLAAASQRTHGAVQMDVALS